jgi:hypothetical protein
VVTPSTATSKPSATRRAWVDATGESVTWDDAVRDWSSAATAVLRDVAGTYNRVITYKELGAAIQSTSDVRTGSLLNNWIGAVLDQVALDSQARGEVLLNALCVRQDGTVGQRYAKVASRAAAGVKPDDPEQHAADVRLLCYRKYATDLPSGGGRAQLTPQESGRRKAAAPEPIPQLCPIHNTVLPRSGQCDDCGE